jgi:hypothetical protein
MSGAPPITADDIEATVFGGEGSGSALLIHNAWVKGHKYVIRHIDAGDIDGDGGKWFREYFRDETDGWEIQAGRIKNAPGNGLLSPSIGTFFESYLGWRDRPEDFPYAAVTWFAPVWNPFDVTTFPAERKIINYAGGDSWPITEYQDSPSYGQIRVETGLASLVAGGGDGSGGGGGGGGSLAREVARWSHPGALTLDIGQLGVDVLVDTMLTLCVARLAGSPTGANAEFDIILHPPGGGSASIFSIGGPLSFAPGGTHLIERVPDTLSIAGGSYLTFDRSQIGSGAPGNDIVCTLIGIPGGS